MSRKNKREELTFELTPLIDVVFLLLIFFMVSSVFKKEELSLLLTLPKTEEGKTSKKQKLAMMIELNQDELRVDQKEVSIDVLDNELQGKDPKTNIVLKVDSSVVYERLVQVLDSLQKNKLENLSLITERKKK
ncbi:biopolymer transporter ExbD [Bacteriovoracaceae bacterium]|nr:biopolymer transporter ExbD [Bacteriovoracaceae bacterium]